MFLSDVGPGDGPFAYVPGSHRLTGERLAWEREQSLGARYSTDSMHGEGSFRIDEDELAALGLPPPLRFAVPANTLIVADTSGFHARTASPGPTHRVEIYATLRRTPFVPWVGGHTLALPPISGRHTALDTALQESLERAGLGRSPWRPVGRVGPFDPSTSGRRGVAGASYAPVLLCRKKPRRGVSRGSWKRVSSSIPPSSPRLAYVPRPQRPQ